MTYIPIGAADAKNWPGESIAGWWEGWPQWCAFTVWDVFRPRAYCGSLYLYGRWVPALDICAGRKSLCVHGWSLEREMDTDKIAPM